MKVIQETLYYLVKVEITREERLLKRQDYFELKLLGGETINDLFNKIESSTLGIYPPGSELKIVSINRYVENSNEVEQEDVGNKINTSNPYPVTI